MLLASKLRRASTTVVLSMGIAVGVLASPASAATTTYSSGYRYSQVETTGGSGKSTTYVDARTYDTYGSAPHGVAYLNRTSGSSLVKVNIHLLECTSFSATSCGSLISQAYEEYVLPGQSKRFTLRSVNMRLGMYYRSCSSVTSSDGFKITNQCADNMRF